MFLLDSERSYGSVLQSSLRTDIICIFCFVSIDLKRLKFGKKSNIFSAWWEWYPLRKTIWAWIETALTELIEKKKKQQKTNQNKCTAIVLAFSAIRVTEMCCIISSQIEQSMNLIRDHNNKIDLFFFSVGWNESLDEIQFLHARKVTNDKPSWL